MISLLYSDNMVNYIVDFYCYTCHSFLDEAQFCYSALSFYSSRFNLLIFYLRFSHLCLSDWPIILVRCWYQNHKTSWKSVPHLVFYSSVQFVCNDFYLFFRCLGWFIRGYHLGLQDCFLNCFKFQTQLLKQLYSNHLFLLVSVLVRCVL